VRIPVNHTISMHAAASALDYQAPGRGSGPAERSFTISPQPGTEEPTIVLVA
jgi:hypothetical protein